jgi:hypothetical protein
MELLQQTSPDGKYMMEFDDAGEIGMSGPWSATGTLINIATDSRKLISKDCGGPAVWSADSRFVALPLFVSRTDQKLVIIEAHSGDVRVVSDSVMLLTLKRFQGNVVDGIRSKVDSDQPVTFDVSSIMKH